MHLLEKLFIRMAFFLSAISGLPLPNSNLAGFRAVLPLAYRSRSIPTHESPGDSRDLPSGSSQGWGGTPANPTICRSTAVPEGWRWWGLAGLIALLIGIYTILALATWGVMSVDLARLTVWTSTEKGRRGFVLNHRFFKTWLMFSRVFAKKVLKVRNRPNWLLFSLVFASIGMSEVLSFLWSHLIKSGNLTTFFLTTLFFSFFGQLLPIAIIPVFHLEFSGRFTWFIRGIMFLMSPIAVVPAYGLRRLRRWKKGNQSYKLDGLLSLEELVAFIHLHEKGKGFGGELTNEVGKKIRRLIEDHILEVETSAPVESELSVAPQSSSIGSGSHGYTDTVATSIRTHCLEGSTAVEEEDLSGIINRGLGSTHGSESGTERAQRQVTVAQANGSQFLEGSTAFEVEHSSGIKMRDLGSTHSSGSGSMKVPNTQTHGSLPPPYSTYVGSDASQRSAKELGVFADRKGEFTSRPRAPAYDLYLKKRLAEGRATDSILM